MERQDHLLPARPLTYEGLVDVLETPLSLGDNGRGTQPSLAQSLTRLQFLRKNLFAAEDWEELAWLIEEGNTLEARRLRKNPLLKIGPRNRLQERVQHFHGRAAIKAVALIDTLEPPLRRLAGRISQEALPPAAPRVPWHRFTLTSPDQFGAPGIEESAALLDDSAPLAHHLAELIVIAGQPADALHETWEHFRWHAREARVRGAEPVPLVRRLSHRRHLNGLLRVALEQLRSFLETIREIHLALASGWETQNLSGPVLD